MNISKTPQGTPEWLDERKGFMTGSNASAIGSNGAGLTSYCRQVVMEKYCNNLEHYTNADMERGNKLESQARIEFQMMTGNVVEEVGFITNEQYPFAGVSLDGITGKEGAIEIKCMNNKNHFNFLLDKKIKSSWVWQMQMGLMISQRKYCYFIAFNPNFDESLISTRVLPDDKMFRALQEGLQKGNHLIENNIELYERAKN